MGKSVIAIFGALFTFIAGVIVSKTTTINLTPSPAQRQKMVILKDVGEAYMDHFGLSDSDFRIIKDAGVNVIEGNFDICADSDDVSYFLNKSKENGLKVIMPAGSGEAEWGYECDKDSYPSDQKPDWQKDKVKDWVNKWKNHPAIYAWDTSNEAGSVFPNAAWKNDEGFTIEAFYLNPEQLKQAYRDVKSADPGKPIMIRMNGWFFYDYDKDFFRTGNPFSMDVADIVMINAYSNVEDYYDDFVPTVTTRAVTSVHQIDPDVEIIVALGAWEEPPLWFMPIPEHLRSEIEYLMDNTDVSGISFFKYGAKVSEWYLPHQNENSQKIWKIISDLKTNYRYP